MTARDELRGVIAARAVRLLAGIRDMHEYAARHDGERVEITRQESDSIINDLRIVAKLIREMAEAKS